MDYEIRVATLDDVEAIVALNALCYPDPAEADALWNVRLVESHLRVFGEGQFVATIDGEVVASATSLIASLGRDPYRDHTWSGMTDGGTLYNHDPFGDTLYGVDINVHPRHRRHGLAGRLYDARKALCERLNLRRIVVGGRLSEYGACARDMTPEEYARRVELGDRADAVMNLQLRNGFLYRKILHHYVRDPLSDDCATLMEWLNPRYRSRIKRQRSVRVSCVQYRMRKIETFADFGRQVRYFTDVASGYGADFVLFPELLTAQLISFIDVKTPQEAILRLTEYSAEVDALFESLARDFQTTIINGSHPTKVGSLIHNVCTLYLPDGSKHRQAKLHITPNEKRWWGIDGGDSLNVIQTPKARVGILICYDVEFPETARYLADQGVDVIFNPFCTDDRQAYLRVRYCAQARAVENQMYVVSAGTVGNLPDAENMDIQYAQSAVFSPSDFAFARDGILVEASPNTETVITTDLDFDALQEAINAGSVRPRADRRPDLFSYTHRF
ncbi:MAG: bifunctional GNAT family N-acetyltransferase/carbon-nitrogen hydrolase family protein [Deltaproteobacteria bacterium]|nr:bifunctional GNAT family N-acetyltransferase/carbon-nitrogen hydrolase family protein [Deltaproteobacteria bacterium]